jgi:hypothetical protein
LKTSELAFLKKGVRFFSALLIDDLFSLKLSPPEALVTLLIDYRKGVILLINFYIDF